MARENPMENLLLVGMSQQMAMRRQLEIIANNVANMNTTAFKGESVLFEEHIVKVEAAQPATRKLSFVRDLATIRNESEGRMETTGGALDLAISGDGFFVVGTPGGERYTRNGHFKLDTTNRIVSDEGHPLLSQDGGEIIIPPNEGDITIARDGSVSTDQGTKGRIGLVSFKNRADMLKIGDSLYQTSEKAEPARQGEIVQGSVEQSNVQPVLEMTKLMDLNRAYQAVSNLMERAEELQRRTIREVGQAPQG